MAQREPNLPIDDPEKIKAAWRAGVVPDAHLVLEQSPELLRDRSAAIDLAYEEYCLRVEAGDAVDVDEFCTRFPAFRSSLARQLEVHQYLGSAVDHQPPCWPAVGERFLGYELTGELGRGTFGRVFQCTQPLVGNRTVVLKVTTTLGNEADCLGRLEHPNIVPIFSVDFDEESGLEAVCMPYRGRATLRNLLDLAYVDGQAPIGSAAVLRALQDHEDNDDSEVATASDRRVPSRFVDVVALIGAQLAEGLQHAHDLHILHGDIKPSNVLISREATPLLLDFNLSPGGDAHVLGGTLPYMAPEQIRAIFLQEPEIVSPRSDIFSLGVLLYELLTGQLPFGEPTPQPDASAVARDWLQQQEQPLPRASRVNAQVDAELAALVDWCLQLEPENRPESMAEVAHALRQRFSPRQRTKRWLQRHPVQAGIAVFATMLLVAAATALTISRPTPTQAAIAQGQALAEQGDFAAAARAFQVALNVDPTLSEIRYQRGRALALGGEIDLATNEFAALCKSDPQGKYWAAWAYCLARQGYEKPCVTTSHRAIERKFVNADVHNNLGWAYLHATIHDPTDYAKAEEHFSQSLELADLPAARINLVRLRLMRLQAEPNQQVSESTLRHARRIASYDDLGGEPALLASRIFGLAASHNPSLVEEGLSYLSLAFNRGISSTTEDFPQMGEFASYHDRAEFAAIIQQQPDSKPVEIALLVFPDSD